MQGPCKGEKGSSTLPSPVRSGIDMHHRSLEFGTHKTEECLFMRDCWIKGTMVSWLWGLRSGYNNFCFHLLERDGRPAGNKSHLHQQVAVHTETGLLERDIGTPPRQRLLRISTARSSPGRPAETSGEHQVYRSHSNANSRGRGTQYIEFESFFSLMIHLSFSLNFSCPFFHFSFSISFLF